ncbi:hypothetical protein XELAEV_18037948mg [Xenopus laevis]|uniref:Uncharacterized protein n=1 Tax=Xenopus laevis TaxID=8355 RepID=A0A974CD13_XENLA|nr:hypothetical protein XELAEV_18037948mg [Xenopus laevis]
MLKKLGLYSSIYGTLIYLNQFSLNPNKLLFFQNVHETLKPRLPWTPLAISASLDVVRGGAGGVQRVNVIIVKEFRDIQRTKGQYRQSGVLSSRRTRREGV